MKMNWLETYQHDFEGFFRATDAISAPSRLNAAILYALQSPGKRLRPRFVEEAGKLVDLDRRAVRMFSFAIEFVHLFSLVHDDLPCMDDDDFRRGLPTVHKKFDEPTALLTGDALLNLAYAAFGECLTFVEKEAFALAMKRFTLAIGERGMIGGQSSELELSLDQQANPSYPAGINRELNQTNRRHGSDLSALMHIQDLKTGALFRAAILTPALLKGLSETDALFVELNQFATDFGFAFQIADDLEDEEQDAKAQAKNILGLLGRENAKKLAREQLTQTVVSQKFSATGWLLEKLI